MFPLERGFQENGRRHPISLRNPVLSRPEALVEPQIVSQNHPGSTHNNKNQLTMWQPSSSAGDELPTHFFGIHLDTTISKDRASPLHCWWPWMTFGDRDGQRAMSMTTGTGMTTWGAATMTTATGRGQQCMGRPQR